MYTALTVLRPWPLTSQSNQNSNDNSASLHRKHTHRESGRHSSIPVPPLSISRGIVRQNVTAWDRDLALPHPSLPPPYCIFWSKPSDHYGHKLEKLPLKQWAQICSQRHSNCFLTHAFLARWSLAHMDTKFARQYSLYQLPQNPFLRLHVCPHVFIHAHSN